MTEAHDNATAAPDAPYVINDPRVHDAMDSFVRGTAALEKNTSLLLHEAYGLTEAQAIDLIVHDLIRKAALLAASSAICYLGREPDPVRWRETTDEAFVDMVTAFKARLAADAETEQEKGDA